LETTTNRLFAAFGRENTESANRGFLGASAQPGKTKLLSAIPASPQAASVNTGSFDYVPAAIIRLSYF
jgi:hypothetical protein